MRPRIQGGGQEPSTSGRETASQPYRPRWPSRSPTRPLRPRLEHVESCSIALGLPPHVPMHRGSLRAAFEQLESPMQARQRMDLLSSLLSLPSWQTRELMLSSPKLLTLSPQKMTMRVQHLAAFVASCPPPLKSRRQDQDEEDIAHTDMPSTSSSEVQSVLKSSPSLLHGWDLLGHEPKGREGNSGSSPQEGGHSHSASMLFGFMPQQLDTFDPPSTLDPPQHLSQWVQQLRSKGQVLSEVSKLIHREPRLLISPADACSVLAALMQVIGLDLITASSLVYRRPLLICRAGGQRVKRGRGGQESPWTTSAPGEEDEIEDHLETFQATINLLEKLAPVAPPTLRIPSKVRRQQQRESAQKVLSSPRAMDPLPLLPSSSVMELVLKEPLILTVPPGALLASTSAILDSFPTLLSIDPDSKTRRFKSKDDEHRPDVTRGARSTMDNNHSLWSMIERCPELLCSSPSAVEGSCKRLSSILSRSKPWAPLLPKLISKPRNLAVAISLGFNTVLLDRLQYLSSTNRDRSMDFKEAMVTSPEDFDEMWPGFKDWVKRLNNNV